MGLSPADIGRARADRADTSEAGFGVLRENWLSFEVFCALGTQWRIVSGFGGGYYEGLDYAAITRDFMGAMGVKKRRRKRVFNDLRIMEAAALEILNERASSKG